MAKFEVLEKKYEILDVNDTPTFRINIDVLNEAFGVGRSMYAKACYPDKKDTYFSGNRPNDMFFIWMPKFYRNSSEWINSVSNDGKFIYEIAEPGKTTDWFNGDDLSYSKFRIVFAKPSPKEPYRFLGVFQDDKLDYLKHSYKRIASKIKLIGNPVYRIELLDDERK